MNRQELQQKTVLLAEDVESCIFLMCYFFPLLLVGKPRQSDLSASNFLVPEEIVRI